MKAVAVFFTATVALVLFTGAIGYLLLAIFTAIAGSLPELHEGSSAC